tara:strand:+ start:912 stop:1019 length:108 start_codon:yes stop_codon:yes gene_type:complete
MIRKLIKETQRTPRQVRKVTLITVKGTEDKENADK